MKITTHHPTAPAEITLVLTTEEAYALMAAVGKVAGLVKVDGVLTVRGHCSAIYNGLRVAGFQINHESAKTITGSLRCSP